MFQDQGNSIQEDWVSLLLHRMCRPLLDLKGICSFQVCLMRAIGAMKIGMSSAAVRSGGKSSQR